MVYSFIAGLDHHDFEHSLGVQSIRTTHGLVTNSSRTCKGLWARLPPFGLKYRGGCRVLWHFGELKEQSPSGYRTRSMYMTCIQHSVHELYRPTLIGIIDRIGLIRDYLSS